MPIQLQFISGLPNSNLELVNKLSHVVKTKMFPYMHFLTTVMIMSKKYLFFLHFGQFHKRTVSPNSCRRAWMLIVPVAHNFLNCLNQFIPKMGPDVSVYPRQPRFSGLCAGVGIKVLRDAYTLLV